MIQISTKGFREAAAKLQGLAAAPQAEQFRRMLLDSVEPIRLGVIANIHSVTGRTVSAVKSGMGSGEKPSAFVMVDKRIASVISRGKPFPYPYAVEAGHGKTPAHPFFRRAVDDNRAEVRRRVNDGAKEVLRPYIGASQTGGEFL